MKVYNMFRGTLLGLFLLRCVIECAAGEYTLPCGDSYCEPSHQFCNQTVNECVSCKRLCDHELFVSFSGLCKVICPLYHRDSLHLITTSVSVLTPADHDTGDNGQDTGGTGQDTGDIGRDTGGTGQDTGDTGQDTGETDQDTRETDQDTGDTDPDTGDTDDNDIDAAATGLDNATDTDESRRVEAHKGHASHPAVIVTYVLLAALLVAVTVLIVRRGYRKHQKAKAFDNWTMEIS